MTERELRKSLVKLTYKEIPAETHRAFLSAISPGKEEEGIMKKKISFSVIIIVVVLLIGTITALAAGVEDINAMLYKIWPEAARALRPLDLSVEEAGIRLDILSASLTDDQLLITYSLTDLDGNRLDEETECYPYVKNPRMGSKHGSDKLLYYDAENHQAVYASYWDYDAPESWPGGFDSGEGPNMITFTIKGLISPVKTTMDLWPLIADQDYEAEAVSVPAEERGLEILKYGEYSYSEDANNYAPKVLNPERNLHIPIAKDIELSGIGWIYGNLHIQIHVSNWLESTETSNTARYLCFINLRDKQGHDIQETEGFYEKLLQDTAYYYFGVNWHDSNDQWIERIFPVQPEDMDQYVIYCAIEDRLTKNKELLNSEWTVSFPVNMIQTE